VTEQIRPKGFLMSDKTVAILGVTGVVGTQMLQCLEERNFPVRRLVPLRERSLRRQRRHLSAAERAPVVEGHA